MAGTPGTEAGGDPRGELAILDGLADAVEECSRDERRLARGIRQLRVGRAAGRTWHDLVSGERQPGVLKLASRILTRITETSGSLRRVLAAGLRRRARRSPPSPPCSACHISGSRLSSTAAPTRPRAEPPPPPHGGSTLTGYAGSPGGGDRRGCQSSEAGRVKPHGA